MTKLNVEFKEKAVLSEDSITGGAFFLKQGTQDLYVVVEVLNEENDNLDPFLRSFQPRQEAFRYNLVNVSNGKMFSLKNQSKYQLFNKMLRQVFTPINSMKISINN